MSKNMDRLLRFAIRYPATLHSYGKERATIAALNALESRGFIIVNRSLRQFRLAMQDGDFLILFRNNEV